MKSHIASQHRDTAVGMDIWKVLRIKLVFWRKYFASYGRLKNHIVFITTESRFDIVL